MKIGIFGGSFNPPHKMHVSIVRQLLKKGYVDKIIVIPNADAHAKAHLMPGTERYRMLKEIFKNDSKVEVSSFEIEGSIYTINTLDYYKREYPKYDFYFICGTDCLDELDTWHDYKRILKDHKLMIVERDTANFEKALKKYERYKANIKLAKINPKVISSSMIRKEILKNGYTEKLKEYLYVSTIERLKKVDVKKYWK